jgi:quercetin dioxygenase-like cupin family protein
MNLAGGKLLFMTPRIGILCAAALTLGASFFASSINSSAEDKPAIETLLETQTTNLGQPIEYPAESAAKITAVIVTLAPGQETGRHRHPVPLYGQVLSGQVTIDYGDYGDYGDYAGRGSKTYKAGEAFMEAVGTWHNGRNSGEEALRILAIFMGAEGVANVEHP